ncbi:MAG: BMC domain-containing protein [Wohlfahrtiimonas sp.]
MINALGLLEVYGFVAGVEAMDAMLKSANVRLLSHSVTPSALVTIVVEGDLAACRAALDAGSAAAERIGGRVLCCKDLGRPEKDTERMVLSFCGGTQADVAAVKKAVESVVEKTEAKTVQEAVKPKESAEEDLVTNIVTFLRKKASKGANMTEVVKHIGLDREVVKDALHKGVTQKLLRKNSNRYYIIEDKL